MTDFTTRARETAEREAERDEHADTSQRAVFRPAFTEGFTVAVSRLPSEEEIADVIARQMPGWNDDTSEPELEGARRAAMEAYWERVNQECLRQGREYARAVRELIEKKMTGG